MSAMAMGNPSRGPFGAHGPFEAGLERVPANHRALSPLSFLQLAARVSPDRPAQIDGNRVLSWGDTRRRCAALAAALMARGIQPDQTVSILSENSVALFEAHFAVPMAGAVLNAIEPAIDAASLAFILDHAETRLLLVSIDSLPLARTALTISANKPPLVVIGTNGDGGCGYEGLLSEGEGGGTELLAETDAGLPDEWRAITLSYTLADCRVPKGVVTHHRGACLSALGLALSWANGGPSGRAGKPACHGLATSMARTNGWGMPWAIAAVTATLIHSRQPGLQALAEWLGDNRTAGTAPTHITLPHTGLPDLLAIAGGQTRQQPLQVLVTGGPADPAIRMALAAHGIAVTEGYGIPELGGLPIQSSVDPVAADAVSADPVSANWAVSPLLDDVAVIDPATGLEVPADGCTTGELRLRGNTVMKGYFKDPLATRAALADGWLHTGDAAVRHVDGRIEIRHRLRPRAAMQTPDGPAL